VSDTHRTREIVIVRSPDVERTDSDPADPESQVPRRDVRVRVHGMDIGDMVVVTAPVAVTHREISARVELLGWVGQTPS